MMSSERCSYRVAHVTNAAEATPWIDLRSSRRYATVRR
jgi:hypothetical protein